MSLRDGDAATAGSGSHPRSVDAGPRWGWRSFDHRPRQWHEALRHALPTGWGQMRSETYLLSRRSTSLVKLQQGRVDVKRRMATEPNGLEAWQTVRRVGFPIPPEDIAALCRCWQVDPPGPSRVVATLDEFHALLAQQLPEVHVLPARSWWREYGLLGCLVQRRTMLVRGTVLEMLAVEHPELVTLRTALQAMQLTEVPHTSSRTALRHLLGWPTHDGHLE